MNGGTDKTEVVDKVARLPRCPGVYCFVDACDRLLYVGKARDLKARVSSYFGLGAKSAKTHALITQVADVEVTVTATEAEALLLEQNLIKAHRPRYNVLLRDDKSYPYIFLDERHPFPRMQFYRGVRRKGGRLFGPYPSAAAVRASLKEIQRLFNIRQCTDSFFANRQRPCLQYQIGRCSAPCVGFINEQDYARDVRHAVHFLEGRSNLVAEELAQRMDEAAGKLQFERAARYRDQIARIRQVQAGQSITTETGDLDVIAVASSDAGCCVAVGVVRGGRQLGYRSFFPESPRGTSERELRTAFLSQYYLDRPVPEHIVCDGAVEAKALLTSVLCERGGRRVTIHDRPRGERRRWVSMARANAEQALRLRAADRSGIQTRLVALQQALDLDQPPARIECFDISHTMGEATVGACVVFSEQGPSKQDYRRFNIEGLPAGDDYGAMRQALERRYRRLRREEAPLPDVLLVDGGAGQLGQAVEVLAELQIDEVFVVAVAKGPNRRPGEEQLFLPGSATPLRLPTDSPALHLIQQIRDEAHRFAVTGHRLRRGKARTRSALEDIPGVGPKRRRELLRQFGGLNQVARAGIADLAKVPGISGALAERIYLNFHPDVE